LYRDAVATVLAHEWDLGPDMFDGVTARGPVPVLYAANPADARVQLDSDPQPGPQGPPADLRPHGGGQEPATQHGF
jgi:hypothetical protein